MKLQTKIISVVMFTSIILNLAFQYSSILNQRKEAGQRLHDKIETNSVLLNSITSVALYNFQRPILEVNLQSFIKDPDIQAIKLKEINGEIEISYEKTEIGRENLIIKNTTVIYNEDIIGEIITTYTEDKINRQLSDSLKRALFGILIVTTVLSIILFLLLRVIIKPIKALTKLSLEISNGNLNTKTNIKSSDEIGILYNSFMKMRNSISEKIKFLYIENEERKLAEEQLAVAVSELNIHKKTLEVTVKQRTSELEDSLHNLKETQKQLIESEKMSSLGYLVAGIAHEVNTPIGIGVTAASHLSDETKILKELQNTNTLSQSKFTGYMDSTIESTQMILSNLVRAAKIIQSFKQVAVDQSSEEKRKFKIQKFIDEVLISTYSKFKHTKHQINVNCPVDFVIDSYPGALSQILTNLLINSLIHGFEKLDSGTITIDIKNENDRVILVYSDTGKGISPSHINKIFDPFFTTKRGQGGSGLGLNITYNLISQTLKGTISCQSNYGEGVTFILNFPCHI